MGFPTPASRPVRNQTLAGYASNTKEDEAILNELFIGNHLYLQRHVGRLTKLIAQLESI